VAKTTVYHTIGYLFHRSAAHSLA